MEKATLIAITGGIGSGKSTVTSIIDKLGFLTFSCDEIVNKLYSKKSVKLLLKKHFPTSVKGSTNPVLDKKELSNIVFSDSEKLKFLTDLITPLVLDELLEQSKDLSGKVFVEVPLLFECNYEDKFDKVLVVMRPKKDRIESVKTRSKLTEEEILSRIKAQVDYDKLNLSNYIIIENKGSIKELKEKVKSIIETI